MSRRRSVLLLLATLMLSAVTVSFSGAASAGGPTSVLLVLPGSGRTASLYTGSPDYDELARLVQVGSGTIGEQIKPDGIGPGVGLTITWLIHDAQVWRVDRVDLSPADGPLIATQESVGDNDIWTAPTYLHSSADGETLVALLDRLGVGPNGGSEPVAAQPVTATSDPVAAPAVAASSPAEVWVWALAGALVGAAPATVITLFGRRLTAARRWLGSSPSGDIPLDPGEDLELLDSSSTRAT